ncbi:MAG: ABC transporter permease [Anaerolineaceae bacterium]|nr:ABC transporter permease [Anaerolineaceae bacterium]
MIESKHSEPSILKKIGNFLIENKIIFVFILLFAALSFTNKIFLTERNLINILRQISVTAIVGVGFTLMLISASIDLSVGSVLGLSAFICALLMKNGVPIWASILITLISGGLMGALTGTITNLFKLPPFITTLAFAQIYRGLCWLLSGGPQIFEFDPRFLFLGTGYVGFIPVPVIVMLLVALITALILNRTRFGRNTCAIGGNPVAARVSGINVFKTSVKVFVYTGMMAALAGIVTTARLDQARPDAGNGIEMDVIAAVVIGGTSLAGGKGTVLGTLIGCLIVGVINNGLTINGVNPYVTMVAKGLIILIAVIIDSRATDIISGKKRIKLPRSVTGEQA